MSGLLYPAKDNVDFDGAVLILTAAGAGTYNSPTMQNFECSGAIVVTNITTLTGTSPTVAVALQMLDAASGQWVTLAAPAAYITPSTPFFSVYPTGTATANVSFNVPLPRNFRIQVVVGGTGPAATLTVGVNTIK